MSERKVLRTMTEIFHFLRTNQTPIYVVTPSPFTLLGMDRWVGGLEFVNYFDVFDGAHPRAFVPIRTGPQAFNSMEDVANYLMAHPQFAARVKDRAKGKGRKRGKVLFVMFDEETEDLSADLGLDILLPSAALRTRLDSKIETTRIGNEAGVKSVPNTIGHATSYAELTALADSAGIGSDLVVQTPYGDSGRTTFFIKSEEDWNRYATKVNDQQLKVMKRINHLPGTIEGCATRHGTLVGPVMTDITGFEEITPYKGGWCGNDVSTTLLSKEVCDKVRDIARRFGNRLWTEGYKGSFCVDFLIDTDTNEVYLGELNPRLSGVTAMSNLITSTYGGCPIFLFHLLEYLDVDYEINIDEVQARWHDYDHWTQLIFKQTEDKVELITKAPTTGVWQLGDDGKVSFVRPELHMSAVGDEHEAFYMRVYGIGEYCYHGADLGCLLARGRMQTDDRKLIERARLWNSGIKAQFASVPLTPRYATTLPEDMSSSKWF